MRKLLRVVIVVMSVFSGSLFAADVFTIIKNNLDKPITVDIARGGQGSEKTDRWSYMDVGFPIRIGHGETQMFKSYHTPNQDLNGRFGFNIITSDGEVTYCEISQNFLGGTFAAPQCPWPSADAKEVNSQIKHNDWLYDMQYNVSTGKQKGCSITLSIGLNDSWCQKGINATLEVNKAQAL